MNVFVGLVVVNPQDMFETIVVKWIRFEQLLWLHDSPNTQETTLHAKTSGV